MVPRDISPDIVDIRFIYNFHEVIGIGRTGMVYRCTDIRSRDIVAIKVIKGREIHGFNEYKLCQWIETLINLDIKEIVKFYKVYTDKSRQLFYIVMNYYSNGSITTSISGGNRNKWAGINNEKLPSACARLLSAIAFIHNKLWLINTTTIGMPLGSISTDNVLLDDEFSLHFLPGIGTPLNWTDKGYSAEALKNELLLLAPEKLLTFYQPKAPSTINTQTNIQVNSINKKTKPSATNNYLMPNNFQMLLNHKDTLLKPTIASDGWALGCLLYALLFKEYPFKHSDIIHLNYTFPDKTINAYACDPNLKSIDIIIHNLLVVNPSTRMSVLQANNILNCSSTNTRTTLDGLIHNSTDTDQKLCIAQLKYIISTMDESLSKLSAMLSNSASSLVEAQEEVMRLSALQTECEKDAQSKQRTIQQLRSELNKVITNMTLDITRADEIDTNRLTNEELLTLENECKKILDKISSTRLLRCSPECVVCLSKPKNIKLDPCKHVCICLECYHQLSDKRCPICRVSVTAVEKVYI